jgi:hypothetical protein
MRQRAIEQQQRPSTVEQFLRRQLMTVLDLVSALGAVELERQWTLASATLECTVGPPCVREKVANRCEQECAKSTA